MPEPRTSGEVDAPAAASSRAAPAEGEWTELQSTTSEPVCDGLAFAAGLMESRVENVNIVNAGILAAERGIDVTEQSSPKKGDFGTLIQADITTRTVDTHVKRVSARLGLTRVATSAC